MNAFLLASLLRKGGCLLAAGCCVAAMLRAEDVPVSSLGALDVIRQHVDKHNVDSEVEFVTMKTIAADGTVTRHGILFMTQRDEQGNHSYLVRVVAPKAFEGVGLLARKSAEGEFERYLYLPALGRVTRVLGGGSSPSFLGSNFTYEDLLKETPERYQYERLPDVEIDGIPCFAIRAWPGDPEDDNKKTPYAFRDILIDQKEYNIQLIRFHKDDPDAPSKSLRALDYHSVWVDGPTMRPRRAFMTDHERGTLSELAVMRSRFNEKLDPALFTPEGLALWNEETRKTLLDNFATAVSSTPATPEPLPAEGS